MLQLAFVYQIAHRFGEAAEQAQPSAVRPSQQVVGVNARLGCCPFEREVSAGDQGRAAFDDAENDLVLSIHWCVAGQPIGIVELPPPSGEQCSPDELRDRQLVRTRGWDEFATADQEPQAYRHDEADHPDARRAAKKILHNNALQERAV